MNVPVAVSALLRPLLSGPRQPLQVLGYSRLVQPPRTRHRDFYVVNTAQFASNTLNNNEVIRNVNAFLEQFDADFRSAA